MNKKPSIDEQIEAVTELMARNCLHPHWKPDPRVEAALSTLRWVKRHAPVIKAILEEFPGAKVNPREDE